MAEETVPLPISGEVRLNPKSDVDRFRFCITLRSTPPMKYPLNGLLLLLTLMASAVAHGKNPNQPRWEQTVGQPGLSHSVRSVVAFDDGAESALYAGGWFFNAGGKKAQHIAKWDGNAWWPLGSGMNGIVRALAVFDDGTGPALYAGGDFTHADTRRVGHIAKWDGKHWSRVGGGLNGAIRGSSMVVFDDGSGPALYVGGTFTAAGRGTVPAAGIAKWDGKNWSSVGGGVRGDEAKVETLAVFNDGNGDALFVGGLFDTAGEIQAENIAKWDGKEWHSLGDGLVGGYSKGRKGALAMAVLKEGAQSALYVGGWFLHAGSERVNFVAKWDGNRWSSLGKGLGAAVFALQTFNDGTGNALYAGGSFRKVGEVAFNGIAKWNGKEWEPLDGGFGGEYPWVYGLTPWNDGNGNALYAGGMFTSAGGRTADRIAAWVAGDYVAQIEIRKTLNLDEAKIRLLELQSQLTATGREERETEARERGIYEEISQLHRFIRNVESKK